MELEGTINQLKEEMPLIIENVLKSMGLNSMPKPATQVCVCVFSIQSKLNLFAIFLRLLK